MGNQKHDIWRLPSSTSIVIKDYLGAGRAVFANKKIQRDIPILATTQELSPIAHVLLRPYRKEVCAICFSYDRGREWKIRDMATATAFCSTQCRDDWVSENDAICLTAFKDIESFIKHYSRHGSQATESLQLSPFLSDGDTSVTFGRACDVWKKVEDVGNQVLEARTRSKPSKSQRKVLQRVVSLAPDPDILSYVLSGVITAYKARGNDVNNGEVNSQPVEPESVLPSLFALMEDDRVFITNPMTPSPMYDYASAYLVLLSLLPEGMLSLISTHLVINLASRASHNAFSIRPEAKSDGDQSGEFLGWGVWPEASFFNHSCCPNVRKERHHRIWSFYADIDKDAFVEESEQLCITYLGGDEKDLDVQERRKRLQDQWGFYCECTKCLHESKENNSR